MKIKFGDQAFALYHKILTRARKNYVAGHIWPASSQFDFPGLSHALSKDLLTFRSTWLTSSSKHFSISKYFLLLAKKDMVRQTNFFQLITLTMECALGCIACDYSHAVGDRRTVKLFVKPHTHFDDV